MAGSDEVESLIRAFSGVGVDEKGLICILGKWQSGQRQAFRKGSPQFFSQDERQFERWDDRHILHLTHQFLRLKDAIVLWTMHPWERDARLLNESLFKGGQHYKVVAEIACTRSSEELLGARRAYHSLFSHSIEEDVAFHVEDPERKLLVALLSSYRYEGPKVNEESARFEAKAVVNAIIKEKGDRLLENEEVVRILSTRSKLHLQALYKHYKEISGNNLEEDIVDGESHLVKEAVQCLCVPHKYFIQVLDASLRYDADEISREGLSRVIVTRADADLKQIKEEYHNKYGVDITKRIEDVANGNYRDFLLTLIARGD